MCDLFIHFQFRVHLYYNEFIDISIDLYSNVKAKSELNKSPFYKISTIIDRSKNTCNRNELPKSVSKSQLTDKNRLRNLSPSDDSFLYTELIYYTIDHKNDYL